MKAAHLAFGSLFGVFLGVLARPALAASTAVCPTNSYDQGNITGGVACAVVPSQTDPAIQDIGPEDQGFGYHVVGIPSDPSQIKGVLLYLQGTAGTPYDPVSNSFSTGPILSEAISANYLVIALAYANPVEVGVLCLNDSACYGSVRQEIIYGTDTSPLVNVNQANSVMHRLSALISFLKTNLPAGFPFPPGIAGNTVDWSHVRVGGGSQGGGHAGYIAMDQLTERVCFLSSPVDAVSLFNQGVSQTVSAAWLSKLPWQTPTTRLKGVTHIDDTGNPQITNNYNTLGMVQSTSETTPNNDWLLITVPEADPHSAPAQDPNLAYARNWACLSDLPLTPAPKITAIAPTTGPVGTTITLSGQNLSGTRAVLVGGLSVPFSQVSSSQATATINATGNSGQVLLITNGGNAPAPKNFTVTAGLTAISPTSGAVGTPVNLNGFGLSSATAVKFNGVKVPFNVVSDSQITATVSSGTNTGTVNVAVPTGTITSSLGFTVLPTLSSFSPTSGPVGSTVTLTGSGFTGVSSVQFGSLYAAFNFLSDTQIAVTVPAGVSTSTIKVTVGGASVTSSARFSVVNSPTITSFSPPSGGVGTSVTINGSNLGATSSVLFNGVAAAPASAFNNSVRVVVPSGAKSGPITVVNAAGSTTSASSFQIYAAPAISSFTPTSGPAGTAVTINGSHFSGTTAVSVGRTSAASFTVKSDSQITATVAANTPTGPLKITNPGGTATSSSYFQVK